MLFRLISTAACEVVRDLLSELIACLGGENFVVADANVGQNAKSLGGVFLLARWVSWLTTCWLESELATHDEFLAEDDAALFDRVAAADLLTGVTGIRIRCEAGLFPLAAECVDARVELADRRIVLQSDVFQIGERVGGRLAAGVGGSDAINGTGAMLSGAGGVDAG